MSVPLEDPPSAPGAVLTASGVVVTVAAPDATAVRVEWQAALGGTVVVTELQRVSPHWWSGLLPGARVGTRYGLRAEGRYAPAQGQRFNPAKLLLDPNAHALDGPVIWHPDLVAAAEVSGRHGHRLSSADSAVHLPRCLVTDDAFAWGDDAAPRTPWADTVIYEAHCKGLTMLHPEIPAEQRGRYAGLAHPAMLEYLRGLGISAVELLPIQQAGLDRAQVQRRVTNYWGYAPCLFAAPDHRFASGADGRQIDEFRGMVRALHAAGLEVILDVVFNHTLEGAADGAMLHLRGLADGHYYQRQPNTPARYYDATGCGHAIAAHDPLAQRLILDSLRWWVSACRVDGFRFDLGATLTRGDRGAIGEAKLFAEMAADPVLGAVKLIVEPWDLGAGGYRVGTFEKPIVEWNDRTRLGIRSFWFGHRGAGELARRVSGSDDLYAARGPLASVTYTACHDGFALADLVRYDHARTGANGEGGADALFAGGRADGVGPDGPSADDPALEAERDATAAAMLLTTLLALGVPMLAHGDERGAQRLGNANAYCHDSPLTWIDWSASPSSAQLAELVRTALAARRRWPALRRSEFWTRTGGDALHWFTAAGEPMTAHAWETGRETLVATAEAGADAARLLWIWHAGSEACRIVVPEEGWRWEVAVASRAGVVVAPDAITVPARCMALLHGAPVEAR